MAELGTMVDVNGGDYMYLKLGLGNLSAYLFAMVSHIHLLHHTLLLHPAFLISDVSGVIVSTWSVRMSHSPSLTDRHTYLNFGMEVQWKNTRSSS